MATSSGRLVFSSGPCSRSSWVLLICTPRRRNVPAGEGSLALLFEPGSFKVTYIRSSKFIRLRLKAVVSALARLLAMTSMRVERARSPVAAEFSAVMAMGELSDLGDVVHESIEHLVLVADHVGIGFKLALGIHESGQLRGG